MLDHNKIMHDRITRNKVALILYSPSCGRLCVHKVHIWMGRMEECICVCSIFIDSVFSTTTNTLLDSHILACEEEWRRLAQSAAESRLLSPGMQGLTAQQLRTPTTPLGAPLILSPRMSVPTTAASLLSASAPPTIEHPGLIYATPYGDYTNYAALTGNPLALTEYADHSGGLFAR